MSLSIDQLRYILNQKKKTIQKNYKELSEKEKLIRDIRRLDKLNEKVKQGIDIKKNIKKKHEKIKTFEEYFEECIKNKKIPKDTPTYLRNALKRALKEHDQGIKLEKSALDKFASRYVFEGIPGIRPSEYLMRVSGTVIDFLTNHRNVKIRMCLVCLMERISVKTEKGVEQLEEDKAYFCTKNYKNLVSTNPDKLYNKCFNKIINDIDDYNTNKSGWYFKEVLQLEITTTEIGAVNGSSYLPLPDWIKNKGAIINIKNKDDKCFLWCILRYLYPRDRDKERIGDLKKYEFSLNTKGITFPMD